MAVEQSIYLDSAATTRVKDVVLAEMLPYLANSYGNPSSVHGPGRAARHAVEQSRERIAGVLDVRPADIVFTGSGTEANNMALASVRIDGMPSRLITNRLEHEAILRPAERLLEDGYEVIMMRPEDDGTLSPDMVSETMGDRPALVSIMAVNNEIGTYNDIPVIGECVHQSGGILHSDAVQAASHYDLAALAAATDMLTLSAHKIGGPKGVGLLCIRPGIQAMNTITGGKQERGRRAGTENVAGIAGFARAVELAREEKTASGKHVRSLRILLEELIVDRLGDLVRVTTPLLADRSAPHILHMIFTNSDGFGLDGEMLVLGMDLAGIHASTGSACSSGAVEPSHVLTAMGIPEEISRGAVRFSLSGDHTESDMRAAADRIAIVVNRVREAG